MENSKLNDWAQTAAAIGVFIGLALVAYEIRVSNRIGIDQANAESLNKFGEVFVQLSSIDGADLFVRAHEGDELSRQEMVRLDNMLNTQITALFYDWTLVQGGTIAFEGGFAHYYTAAIQWYLGSPVGRRKWETDRGGWDSSFATVIDSALAAQTQRNVLGEIDYLRGAESSMQ